MMAFFSKVRTTYIGAACAAVWFKRKHETRFKPARVAWQFPSVADCEVRLTEEQKEKLNKYFDIMVDKSSIDYNNNEIQDLQKAMTKMLDRLVTRVNNRGIFTISHKLPCGSMAEKTSIWKIETRNDKSVSQYTEFDFLAILKGLVVLRLNVPVNNFSVISGRSHRFLGN